MWNKIVSWFTNWFKQFRPQLKDFLFGELDAVKEILWQTWKDEGQPNGLTAWKDVAFHMLKMRYKDVSDTHLQIILHMAYDALKQAKLIP